jgi:hypothetical protein
LLAVVLLVLERELGLDDLLAQRAPVIAQVQVSHQLHRDRRAALHDVPGGEVLERGAKDAGRVDAFVFVEALVLDRDRGVPQLVGDFIPADRASHLIRGDVAEARAVGGEDLRGASFEDRMQRLEPGRRAGDVEHIADGRDRPDDERKGEGRTPDQDDARGTGAIVPAPALACLS